MTDETDPLIAQFEAWRTENRSESFVNAIVEAHSLILRSLSIHVNRVHPDCESLAAILTALYPQVVMEMSTREVSDRLTALQFEIATGGILKNAQLQFAPLAAAVSHRHAEGWSLEDQPQDEESIPEEETLSHRPSTTADRQIGLFEESVLVWKTGDKSVDKQTGIVPYHHYLLKRQLLRERLVKWMKVSFPSIDEHDADDIVDRLIEFYERPGKIQRLISYPQEYLRWRLFRHAVRFKNRRSSQVAFDEVLEQAAEEENPIDQVVIERVRKLLPEMPELERQIAIASYWDEFQDSQISQKLFHLGLDLIGAGNISKRRNRYFERLRELLGDA